MLKKRLIGVITVKNGWAVQSFGYKRYLPLGKPECLVENLDRWGADEILVQVIDRSNKQLGPDFELLERLGRLGLETPLIYGGGIRTVEHGVRAIQSGADRLIVDSLLRDDVAAVHGLSERLGAQAIIAALPLSWDGERVEWLDYRHRNSSSTLAEALSLAKTAVVSEICVIDWQHEGHLDSFDLRLIKHFPVHDAPLIAFGGISNAGQMAELLQMPNISGIATGNFLSYREHAIQKYKAALAAAPLRPPAYETKYSTLIHV